MTYGKSALIIFYLALLVVKPLPAQGIPRSTGIGFRANFWNITNRPTTISVSAWSPNANVDVNGAGGTLYFFSRIQNNWFFDLQFEAVASVQTITSASGPIDSTSVNVIMPILLGLHYDLLSSRLSSKVQPYISFGLGPYWSQKGKTTVDGIDPDVEGQFESQFFYGGYGGLGANILFTDWLALNLDLKYHLPELNVNHSYSGLDFGFGLSFMWGKKSELFQLQDIKVIVNDIYPAYYHFYNTYPLALVSVKNIADYPIEVNIRSQIESYSERPSESGFIEIMEGETADIPVTAVFGQKILQASINKPAVLDIEIEGRAGRSTTKSYSTQLLIHSRNSWNGDMDKLVYFITPDNAEILQMTRALSNAGSDENLSTLDRGCIIFNALRDKGIGYHPDPNIPFYKDDRVQFALETLEIGSGDCDDLVVLYASCLESLGIRTAFVEVRDPKKSMAHLYLIFDSGFRPDQAGLVSSNEKRYIIREHGRNERSVWIPVETTLLSEGFDAAWQSGATSYLTEGILRNGLAAGWVRIIDVE